jgi:hypothetical protein
LASSSTRASVVGLFQSSRQDSLVSAAISRKYWCDRCSVTVLGGMVRGALMAST